MMAKEPVEFRLYFLIQRFEALAGSNQGLDRYIAMTQSGMGPRDEEELTGDLNNLLDLLLRVESFPSIQTIAETRLAYQGADVKADWLAIRTNVAAARDRLAIGGATRWDSYSHTVVDGRGVITVGTRTDGTLQGHLAAVKASIQTFLNNIP